MCNINEVFDGVFVYVFVFHICDDDDANCITLLLDSVIECVPCGTKT